MTGIIHWFLLLAYSEDASQRHLACELLSLIINSADQQKSTGELVVAVLCSQCCDTSATVRARALLVLSECIESDGLGRQILCTIFDKTSNTQQPVDLLELLLEDNVEHGDAAVLPDLKDIMEMLVDRVTDEKVHVRKNALHLLIVIMRHREEFLRREFVTLIGDSCRDSSVLVRSQMAQVVTDLVLHYSQNMTVHRLWVTAVLPLVLDGEARVQTKALDSALRLLFSHFNPEGQNSVLTWSLLKVVTDLGFGTYLGKAAELLAKDKLIDAGLMKMLMDSMQQSCQDTKRSAWTVMSVLCKHIPVPKDIQVSFV